MANGSIHTGLSEKEVREIAMTLRERDIRAVAISFLHAYRNPVHERMAGEILVQEWPECQVTLSSDVSQQGREYERTSTAVVNAYLVPVLGTYLRQLSEMLPRLDIQSRLWVMQSSGGLV